MKLLHYNMFQKLKYIVALCLLIAGFANAQVTVQSPYSKYGIGNIRGSLLPQLRAMGGISTAVYKGNGFNNINMQNPASYAGINLTTLDIGMSGALTQLENPSLTENSFNATLSHVAMAFPVTRKSALSIGIMPYSELGYDFKNTVQVGTTPGNTKTVNYLYRGEGGLTKAYLGYGLQFGDHFRLGANLEYLFGNLIRSGSTEYVNEPGSVVNSRIQDKNNIGGVSFSYGAQYDISLDNKTLLVFGYSGSSASNVNSSASQFVTLYVNDELGNERTALDTLFSNQGAASSLKLPLVQNFGVSIQRDNKWLIGADYRMGNWSNLSIGGVNQNLQNTYGVSVGGQFTPDITSISNYFKRVDYRLGFAYDKTYIQLNNEDVKQMAVTFGLGLPLSSYMRNAFYRVNIAAELGRRGDVANNLLQERYMNFHLNFTLNDRWFQRFRFD